MGFSLLRTFPLVFSFVASNAVPQDANPAGATQSGTADNCNAWHTVKNGEYCSNVEELYDISHDDFIKWNPDVSEGCTSGFWPEYSYCVGVGNEVDVSSTSLPIPSITDSKNSSRDHSTAASTMSSGTTSTPLSISSTTDSNTTVATATSSATDNSSSVATSSNTTYSIRASITSWNLTVPTIDTEFPPKRTQSGQPSYCRDWHYVTPADTCENIVGSKAMISMEEFHEWNPSVGSDCSGLYVGWWVCIRIQPQTMTALFEYFTSSPPLKIPPYTGPYTPTTLAKVNSSFTATPTQSGLAPDCQAFHHAKPGATCREVLKHGILAEEQFFEWNPALKGNCDGLLKGYWYCVAAPGYTPLAPTVTTQPSPVPKGQPSNCRSWYRATSSGKCDDLILLIGAFEKEDFIAWNPGVGPQCNGVRKGLFYCVGVPGTPTTRTGSLPAMSSFPTVHPTQSGMASNCEKKWLVSRSDTCDKIAKANRITEEQLLSWNPAVGTSSCDNLIPDVEVCVMATELSSSDAGTTVTPVSTTEEGK